MYWCCVVANTPIFALFSVLSVVTHTLQVHCAISSAVCSLACSVHWECLGLGFMQRWTDRLLCTLPRPAVSSNAHFHLLYAQQAHYHFLYAHHRSGTIAQTHTAAISFMHTGQLCNLLPAPHSYVEQRVLGSFGIVCDSVRCCVTLIQLSRVVCPLPQSSVQSRAAVGLCPDMKAVNFRHDCFLLLNSLSYLEHAKSAPCKHHTKFLSRHWCGCHTGVRNSQVPQVK